MFDFIKKKAAFDAIGLATDCHCHLLPGVDDGSETFEESQTILTEMIRLGIKTVVLTPHINPDVYPDSNEAFLQQRYTAFTASLPGEITSALNLSLGAEYMVTPGFEERDPLQLIQFLPGKVLIEMSYLYPSKNMEEAIFNLVMAGLKPVIAHPERYLYYAHRKDMFERFHDMGAEFQMNALSLSGAYGKESLSILEYLLDMGWYSYIATDTHSLSHLRRLQSMRFDISLLGSIRKNLE